MLAGCGVVALPVSLKEVGVAGGLPPDGCIDPVIGDVPAVIHQLLRVAGLQVGLPEQPEPVPCKAEGEGGWRRGGHHVFVQGTKVQVQVTG